jgi:hypothetical protein
MALFSAWDWNVNQFRIYETPRPASIGDDPEPPRPTKMSILGAVPDKDVKLLPSGTSFRGLSTVPVGEIVRDPRIKGAASKIFGSGGDGIGGLGAAEGTWMAAMPLLLIGGAIAAFLTLAPPSTAMKIAKSRRAR